MLILAILGVVAHAAVVESLRAIRPGGAPPTSMAPTGRPSGVGASVCPGSAFAGARSPPDMPRPGGEPGLGRDVWGCVADSPSGDGPSGGAVGQLAPARQVVALSETPIRDRQYLPALGGSTWALYPVVRVDQK